MDERFNNGAFLVSRSIFITKKDREGRESIWTMPPFYLKLWLWMIGRCNHRDKIDRGQKFERGSFRTTLEEMVEQTRYRIGWRTTMITKRQAWGCLEWMRENDMIETRKTTRGIFIEVLQYDEFQTLKNYESNNEGNDELRNPNEASEESNEEGSEEGNDNKQIETAPSSEDDQAQFFPKEIMKETTRTQGRKQSGNTINKNEYKNEKQELKKQFVEVLEFFNITNGVTLKETSKKIVQFQNRRSKFSIDEIKLAIENRSKDKWAADHGWTKDWDSLFRNDEKIEHWMNRIPEQDKEKEPPKYSEEWYRKNNNNPSA